MTERRAMIERAIEINKLGEYEEEIIQELQELWSRDDLSGPVHTVQLVYTSPTGYSEDRYTTVAVFTSEDRARLFVEWAERQRKEIFVAYHRLKEDVGLSELSDKLNVHSLIRMILPTDGYGTDRYHFQYDDEFDLDPTFG